MEDILNRKLNSFPKKNCSVSERRFSFQENSSGDANMEAEPVAVNGTTETPTA